MSGAGRGGAGMRPLVLGMNYAPEPVGIGVYTAGLAEGLAVRGHDVEVVAATPYYPGWRPMPGAPRGWSRRVEAVVAVRRCPHPTPRRPTELRRLAHQAA